jgi:hypothetical protein
MLPGLIFEDDEDQSDQDTHVQIVATLRARNQAISA